MSYVVSKKAKQEKTYRNHAMATTIIAGSIFIGYFVMLKNVVHNNMMISTIFIVLFAVAGFDGMKNWKKAMSFSGNIDRDKKIIKTLRDLPENYTVILNKTLKCKNNKNSGVIDALVIGANGVFVIGFYDYDGIIKGKISDDEWSQELQRIKYIPNPIIKNDSQLEVVSAFLKENDLNHEVRGLVVFLNDNVIVKVNSHRVFGSTNGLCQSVIEFKPKKDLSEELVEKFFEIFDKSMS